MKNTKTPNFFHDKPLFGLDIGHGSLKVMQIEEMDPKKPKQLPKVVGFGFTTFDKSSQADGVIIDPEIIAKAAHELFKSGLIGDITTRRVAIAIPAYRTFTRLLQLPLMKSSADLKEAVELEAEQYISMSLDELYLDYEIVGQDDQNMELFVVAVPRSIVDSYLDLAQIIGLEPVMIEPTSISSGRLFTLVDNSDSPAFIIDFGSLSCDISIYDGHTLVTGTVEGGGVNFTTAIKDRLGVSTEEAGLIKTRYGLSASKRQDEIRQALEPTLERTIKEIRRMLRYYEERYGNKKPVNQIITIGGGANMAGLSEYFTQSLRMAVRHVDPWHYLDYKGLQPPSAADKPMYATVAGLSLTHPKGVFNHD